MRRTVSRRSVLLRGVAAVPLAALAANELSKAQEPATDSDASARTFPGENPIAVSTYSFWRFQEGLKLPIETCIDLAAEWGFDAVEILHVQMEEQTNAYLQKLKQRAFLHGVALCGLSTHQGFVSPDKEVRDRNIRHTQECIEVAYRLGIPMIRVNTGRWGTIRSFDELMKNRGVEPTPDGRTDEEAFAWVIDSLQQCLPKAEECGVTLALENHWGLSRTPEAILRIVRQIGSPWLRVLMDTGNFLEDPYEALEMITPETVYVQAKTYFGGGVWYTLDLDYPRIAKILKRHNYQGYVSLEFEGRENYRTAIPKSLTLLRQAFQTA